MHSVLFIVNPKAGRRGSPDIGALASSILDSERFVWDVSYTRYAGHAERLSEAADADIVVAVGGDGTVNEVARGLVGSGKILGIIPCGSGNGLAFHYHISPDAKKAMSIINDLKISEMDYGLVNGYPFFCTCGAGMDAEVSMNFAKCARRGLPDYMKTSVRTIIRHRPGRYRIVADGMARETTAALVTIGNACQWGNNAYITPRADTSDGLLDVTVVRPFGIPGAIPLAVRLFSGKLLNDRHVESFVARELTVYCDDGMAVHYDGDFMGKVSAMDVSVVTGGLYIIH